MKYIKILFLLCLLSIFFPRLIEAQINERCDNRYVTLVNPVRGRDLWLDKSTKPLFDQYSLIEKHKFSVTWLMQYDVLVDSEIIELTDDFDERQEFGLFLEVSPKFAQDARVLYPHAVAWNDPNAIFLSGYAQSERKRLIDTLFDKFNEMYGYYPKSVGAWWIDSYSLSYMDEKYGIDTVLIVADQKTTDDYGVWGQWWGVPYRPRNENILIPADSPANASGFFVIQWAQR